MMTWIVLVGLLALIITYVLLRFRHDREYQYRIDLVVEGYRASCARDVERWKAECQRAIDRMESST